MAVPEHTADKPAAAAVVGDRLESIAMLVSVPLSCPLWADPVGCRRPGPRPAWPGKGMERAMVNFGPVAGLCPLRRQVAPSARKSADFEAAGDCRPPLSFGAVDRRLAVPIDFAPGPFHLYRVHKELLYLKRKTNALRSLSFVHFYVDNDFLFRFFLFVVGSVNETSFIRSTTYDKKDYV